MEPNDTPDSFRRFLERATEDPLPPVVDLSPRIESSQQPAPAEGAAGRRLLLVAAVLVFVVGGAVALQGRGSTGVVESVATEETDQKIDTASAAQEPSDPSVPKTDQESTESTPTSAATTTSSTTIPVARATSSPTASSSSAPGSSPTTGTTGTTEKVPDLSATAFLIEFDQSLSGAANGTKVRPMVGPELTVNRVGEDGAIQAVDGGGLLFLPGGQQRRSYAVVSRTGPDLAGLMPDEGRMTVVFTSQVDIAERTVPTGRNIHIFFEIVSEFRSDSQRATIALHIDPAIGPYLTANIHGVTFSHTLTDAEIVEFSAGSLVELSIEWSRGQGRLELNGRTVEEVSVEPSVVDWGDTARFSLGGSANLGGGYFTTKHDALRSFEILRAE